MRHALVLLLLLVGACSNPAVPESIVIAEFAESSSVSAPASVVVGEQFELQVTTWGLVCRKYGGYEVRVVDHDSHLLDVVIFERNRPCTDIGDDQVRVLPFVLHQEGTSTVRIWGRDSKTQELISVDVTIEAHPA